MRLFVSIFALFICSVLYSQKQNQTEYRATAYTGFIAHNYSKLPPIKPAYVGELSFGRKYCGKSEWHKYYNYPTFYGSIIFGYPGNPEYGYFVGISPQISLTKKIGKKFNYNFKAGIGLSYHTNPYDVVTNPANMLVGSHFIAIVNGVFSLEYIFDDYNFAGFSAGAIHFSNGHAKLPNIGMNMPVMNVYFKHLVFNDKNAALTKTINEKTLSNKLNYFITYGAGMHEFGSATKPANGPKYLVNTISFGVSKIKNYANKHSFGINFMHYNSFEKFIINQEINIGNPFLKSSAVNVFWGHEFMFGDFGFYSELGIDIYKPFYRYFVTIYGDKFGAKDIIKSINSNKLGLRYSGIKYANTKLILGINLKANMAQADFIEIFGCFEF
jgi:hypothetical protein